MQASRFHRPARYGVGFAVLLACLIAWPTGAAKAAEEVAERPVKAETVEDLAEIERRVEAVIEKAADATVCVRAGGGSGSGVIISEDGYVLTAGHVSSEPDRPVTFVFPDGKTVRGKTLGINVGVDAGLAKITDEGDWPHVEMGDMEGVEPGAWVVAMGHPGGFNIERPVVARLGRINMVRSTVIRTDCTIIGGDSGGPLFNLDGEVVGIHSRISNSLRHNYHVPIAQFTDGWDRMAAGEVWNRVARGGVRPGGPFIGVQGANREALGEGAAIGRVNADSPAEEAGLRRGDVIIEFDGKPIGSFGDLALTVRAMEPGDKAAVIVQRGEEQVELEIVIGKAGGGE